ncbi:hypothetical protein [Muricoccus radiodurans]|uniref:hypothetical protein n=1 Tax=Muricoccus radiodurans TaxID=2231721 RepID=UPI003CE9AA3A
MTRPPGFYWIIWSGNPPEVARWDEASGLGAWSLVGNPDAVHDNDVVVLPGGPLKVLTLLRT